MRWLASSLPMSAGTWEFGFGYADSHLFLDLFKLHIQLGRRPNVHIHAEGVLESDEYVTVWHCFDDYYQGQPVNGWESYIDHSLTHDKDGL